MLGVLLEQKLISVPFFPLHTADIGMKIHGSISPKSYRGNRIGINFGLKKSHKTIFIKDDALSWAFSMKYAKNNIKMSVLLNCY